MNNLQPPNHGQIETVPTASEELTNWSAEREIDRAAERDANPEIGTVAHLRDLTPDPQNRRQHTERNIAMIVDSLQRDGFGRSILIDENNELVAGHGVVEAAAEAGIERVRIIEASGHEIIAVRRRGLTDEQKRHLALADNRAAELATWDLDQLRADVDAGLDLGAFFEATELVSLLGSDCPPPRFEPQNAAHQLDSLAKHCATCRCREEDR